MALIPSTAPAADPNNLIPGREYDIFSINGVFRRRGTFVRNGRESDGRDFEIMRFFTKRIDPNGTYMPLNPNSVNWVPSRSTIFRPVDADQRAKELRALDTAFENQNSRLYNFPSGPNSIIASFLTGKKGSFQQQRHAAEREIGMEGPPTKYGGRRRKTRKASGGTRRRRRCVTRKF